MGMLANQVKVLVKKDLWVLKSHKKSLCGEILLPVMIAAAAGALLWLATNGQTDIQLMANTYDRKTGNFVPSGGYFTNLTEQTLSGNAYGATTFVTPRDWSSLSDSCAPYVPYGHFFYEIDSSISYSSCRTYRYQLSQIQEENYTGFNIFSRLGLNVANDSEDLEDQYTKWYQLEKARSSPSYQAITISTPTATLPMPMDGETEVGYNSQRALQILSMRPMLENLYFGNASNGAYSNFSSAPAGLYNFSTFLILYPPESNTVSMFATIIGILLQFAFLPLAITTGGRLVDEKRTKMREHLRIMGVRPIAYLLSVYGFGVARVTLISVCMFIAFAASQSGLPMGLTIQAMLVQWVFGMSLVSWATLMPCFFSKSIFSAVLSCLFILVFNLGAVFLTDPAVPPAILWITCLLFSPSAGIIATAQILGRFSATIPIPVGACITFMTIQIVVYAALSQYLYALNPGEYGVSQHWAFPLYQLKRWWTGTDGRDSSKDSSDFSGENPSLLTRGEEPGFSEDTAPKHSIVLEDLYKFYGSQRDTAAVNGLSLTVRKGEIFALLGHNGAGKTTTISMLTGMLEATNYKTALIDGLDLEKDVDMIRHHIGTCPQFDILFEDLSAAQHMEIFAALKDVPNERGTEILEKLALPLDGQKSVTFSGGMKRRLSVACAMVGGSPIVFLDEPSSGLDPMSRRQLWDMIRYERDQGKTIILTTHFMEEADYLGERIAIMSHGRLYCCDTATALKQKYGVGYYLTIVKAGGEDFSPKDNQTKSADEERPPADGHLVCDVSALLSLCQKHCPGASISQESLGDASILLPTETLGAFGNLLTALEEQQQVLGVSSYGIRMNSLEDVFVSISEKESGSEGDALDMSAYNTSTLEGGLEVEDLFAGTVAQSSPGRFLSQVWTVLVKKMMFFSRSKRMIFLGIVVPLVLVAAAWASAIPLSGNNWSQSNYEKSGTKVPDYASWDVPYFGTPTDEQKRILDRASVIASERTEFFPDVPDNQKVQLSFPTFDTVEAKNGMYIDPRSIAFTSATFSAAKAIVMGNVDSSSYHRGTQYGFNYYYGHSTNASSWALNFNRHFNPVVAQQFYLCLRQAWYEVVMEPITKGNASIATNLPIRYQPINITVDVDGITPAPTSCLDSYSANYCNRTKDGSNAFLLIPTGVFGGMAIAQYAASACLQVADELNRHVFQTMRMHGMSALAYWSGTLLFDTLLSLLLVGCMMAGPWVRDVWILKHGEFAVFAGLVSLGNVLFILLSNYAYMCYLPSLKPNSHIALMLGSTILFMLIPTLISLAWLTNGTSIPDIVNAMFPQKALLSIYAALPMSQNAIYNAEHPFSASLGQAILISTFLWCLIPLTLLWAASTSALRSFKPSRARFPLDGQESGPTAASPLLAVGTESTDPTSAGAVLGTALVDSDVTNEEKRVEARPEEDMTEACHLEKIYPGGKVAVKGVTFGVRRGECFGLLGPNGAGKTTTVKMLLKEHSATYGAVEYPYTSIRPNSRSLDSDYQEARLGVCQQHDTLWETFTAEEHLHLYLRIRLGSKYRKELWDEYVKNAIKKVYLDAGKKHSSQYSGGMKRKLAVAIALYTGAKTVFLDEPSTGMDPYARRAMWKSIKEALANDRGVILTTHSMEEADAVCARIAIVAQGVMKCIGSSQHLKNKFGTGYAISLTLSPQGPEQDSLNAADQEVEKSTKMSATQNEEEGSRRQEISEENLTNLDKKMSVAFKGVDRAEVQGSTVQYRIPTLNVATAFSTLSSVATEWGLDSYSVNQVTSLEQIFIGFATQADEQKS